MNHILLVSLSVLLLFVQPVQAQSWCLPGAVWNYNWTAGSTAGCETRTYAGDTLIDGFNCQRIEVRNIGVDYLTDAVDTTNSFIHTRELDGVVFLYMEDLGVAQWDTLYWFTAPIGARWYPLGPFQDCPGSAGQVEVLAIEQQIFGGQSLQVLTLGQLDAAGEVLFTEPQLIERLGTPLMFLPVTCPLGELWGITRTYHDALWEGYDSGETSTCDAFNSVADRTRNELITIFPNPVGNYLRIQGPEVVPHGTLWIRDALGREVMRGSIDGSSVTR